MQSRRGAEALRKQRAEVSLAKQRSVLQAIDDHAARSLDITIAAISRSAKVSREFIHSHPHLHDAVRRAAEQTRHAKAELNPLVNGDVRGLKADRKSLLHKIERQKTQISELLARVKELEGHRQRWLGAQLSNFSTVDPEIHAELQITNERLMSDNAQLRRTVAEQRQTLEIARADLAAVREGWAEDMARHSQNGAEVLSLQRVKSSSR